MLFLLALAAPAPLQPTSDEPEDSKTGFDWKNAATKLDDAFGLDKWKEHTGVSLCGPYAQMCCCGDNGGSGPGGDKELDKGQWMGGTISVPMCMPTPPPTEKKGSKESDPCGRNLPALYGTAANANWPEKFRHILHGELKPKGWLVCHKCSTSQLNVATVSAAYKYLSPIGSVGKKVGDS